jgi:putative transposase
MITEKVEKLILGTILNKAKDLACTVHAIGGVEDHIHVAITIPPKLAVVEVIGQLKGASSYYVNQQLGPDSFRWQRGYGALSFSSRAMEPIVAYIRNQKEHHRQNTTIAIFERWDDDD